ncbi:hypothetical protein M427DRAFT_43489 [Gonapodya prolifera JEL478]|uniref:Uncharacterized protein n=1 Tax=Gonapodya prolifera (strain JEL478) TaxID=1344416 RepID=A0A139AIT6_GONPJ|nr:hypothetical protein M427DRAFT_43489 [Gonapodya prolifera JEL478]|eukprot:KXS16706.1 hypothetical protein M427DRAFT_43489 [Gonapodya prolifera JEL478]
MASRGIRAKLENMHLRVGRLREKKNPNLQHGVYGHRLTKDAREILNVPQTQNLKAAETVTSLATRLHGMIDANLAWHIICKFQIEDGDKQLPRLLDSSEVRVLCGNISETILANALCPNEHKSWKTSLELQNDVSQDEKDSGVAYFTPRTSDIQKAVEFIIESTRVSTWIRPRDNFTLTVDEKFYCGEVTGRVDFWAMRDGHVFILECKFSSSDIPVGGSHYWQLLLYYIWGCRMQGASKCTIVFCNVRTGMVLVGTFNLNAFQLGTEPLPHTESIYPMGPDCATFPMDERKEPTAFTDSSHASVFGPAPIQPYVTLKIIKWNARTTTNIVQEFCVFLTESKRLHIPSVLQSLGIKELYMIAPDNAREKTLIPFHQDGLPFPTFSSAQVLFISGPAVETPPREVAFNNATKDGVMSDFGISYGSPLDNTPITDYEVPSSLISYLNLLSRFHTLRSENSRRPIIQWYILTALANVEELHNLRIDEEATLSCVLPATQGRTSKDDRLLEDTLLVIVEAKKQGTYTIAEPQLLAEVATCQERRLRKGYQGTVYGIITDGEMWIFVSIDNQKRMHWSEHISVTILGNMQEAAIKKVYGILVKILSEAVSGSPRASLVGENLLFNKLAKELSDNNGDK